MPITDYLLKNSASGGNNISLPDEVKDRIGASNAVRPPVRMQFKSSTERHLNSDSQWLGKKVSHIICFFILSL